jgi:hypothetical protein
MHPRTDEMLRHLDANRVVLRAAVDSVPANRREIRPSPERWSVAEVLEHLVRVEESLVRILSAKLSEAKAAGQLRPQADTSPIAGLLSHDRVIDRRRPVTAGERVLPRGELDSTAALTAIETARQKLRELVTSLDGLDLAAFTFPHPVLGPINGYQWFLFIGSHEARHAAQIREIGAEGNDGVT